MFGKLQKPHVTRPKGRPKNIDINLPCPQPGNYGHVAAEPRTNYDVISMLYHQRLDEINVHHREELAQTLNEEKIIKRNIKHEERKIFNKSVKKRFQEKVKLYEENIERRRQELRKLLCSDEQEHILETIAHAQKGVNLKMEAIKERVRKSVEKREIERMELVNQKRIQQLVNESDEIRPLLSKKHALDVHRAQYIQIKENETRREAEKEIDNIFADLMRKGEEYQMQNEVQKAIKSNEMKKETVEVLEKQIRGHELLKQEMKKVTSEEATELEILREQLRREEMETLDAKRRKCNEFAKELKQQIAIHEAYVTQRKREEATVAAILSQIAEEQLSCEMSQISDIRTKMKQECMIYQRHLKALQEERKREEQQLDKLLMKHRKMIENNQDEARCKMAKAKEQLQKNVLLERGQQLEYKRREAENMLKLKEAENELLRMTWETNERLQAESDRMKADKMKQYEKDLKKQIDDKTEQSRLEKQQLERELAEGLAEEERRHQLVLQLVKEGTEASRFEHPNKIYLEMHGCPCSDNSVACHSNPLAQQKNQ